MGTVTGLPGLTGSFGGLSAYRMRGSNKIILRQKGGATKERIQKDKSFALTRRYNQEWKACILAARQITHALYPVKHLADFNYSGSLNGLCKSIQKDATTAPLGQRPVLLSQQFFKLEGFSLNRENSFESIVKHPLQYDIDRAIGRAVVQLPELIPGINLYNPKQQPMYRLVCTLGAVADIVYNEERKMYQPAVENIIHPAMAATDWCSYQQTTPAGTLAVALDTVLTVPEVSLVLSVGIEFGIPVSNTEIRTVKYAGAAKVVRVG